MMLPLLACGVGVYLGLHFNILVLLPFSVLGAGAFVFSSWTSGQSFFDSASVLLFPIISVQAGYMLGLTARETYGQLLARLNIGQSKQI
jgi:nitric oxide reductase large subunit